MCLFCRCVQARAPGGHVVGAPLHWHPVPLPLYLLTASRPGTVQPPAGHTQDSTTRLQCFLFCFCFSLTSRLSLLNGVSHHRQLQKQPVVLCGSVLRLINSVNGGGVRECRTIYIRQAVFRLILF